MKTIHSIVLSLNLALFLAGCAGSPVSLPPSETIIEKKQSASIHPTKNYFLGQVQVRVAKEEVLSDVIADLKTQNNAELSVLDKIPNQPIYLLEVNSLDSVDTVVKALKRNKNVVAAARNTQITADQLRVNDPMLPTQWALSNQGQEAPRALSGKAGADIGMEGITATGSYDTVVGVIDTGIDYYHEDLAITETVDGKQVLLPGSNIWTNPGEIPGNGLNDDNNGDPLHGISYVDDVHGFNFVSRNGDPLDDQGHGTHVSGVIGALRNNFKGIVGINQKVSLMGLKFLNAEGSGSDFDAQTAIYYAIDMKKRFPEKRFILTNSWGSAGRNSANGDEDDFLLTAFADAARANILVVAAAGNDGTSNRFAPHYPANYASKLPAFMTVAATNNLDNLASFSSYGYDQVQIAAPGVLIMSTVPERLFGLGYAAWSGTSMATPQVTGAAALVWSENPNMTAEQVKARLLNTVDVLPQLHGSVSTSGRLNVKRALSGDENAKILPVAEEVALVQESPRGDEMATYDLMTKFESKGAKEISVCFSRIDLMTNLDWIQIMGSDFLVKDTMTGNFKDRNFRGETRELCSAPVLGDTIYVRLSKQGAPPGAAAAYPQYAKQVPNVGLLGFQTKSLKVVHNEEKK